MLAAIYVALPLLAWRIMRSGGVKTRYRRRYQRAGGVTVSHSDQHGFVFVWGHHPLGGLIRPGHDPLGWYLHMNMKRTGSCIQMQYKSWSVTLPPFDEAFP